MASTSGVKRKRVTLSLAQKLELIAKLESGHTVAEVCEIYGVKKQTVSDIKKSKEKLKKYSVSFCIDPSSSKGKEGRPRKHMRTGQDTQLDEAVLKWYRQEKSAGMLVRGVEILSAAKTLATHLGVTDFKGSDGWLWRFRQRHGLGNTIAHGEAGSADVESVQPFREELVKVLEEEGVANFQLYNGDETGIFWRRLPTNTQAMRSEGTQRGKKMSKERISALCVANATGTHRLPLAVVGKAKRPRSLKNVDMERDLPVHYYHTKNAWFTRWIIHNWFHHHFVPSVKKHQIEDLKIPPDQVKAILLFDNAPAHPSGEELVSGDGRIRVMFLPPNTTSLVQPMDQGIISVMKRRYVRRYLEEVLVVLEKEEDAEEDTRGARTLENIKKYSIKSALYNLADSWRDIKCTTLANCWNKLLMPREGDDMADFEGFDGGHEVQDFFELLRKAGEKDVTRADVQNWMDDGDADPGYEMLTPAEIAAQVSQQDADKEEEEDAEDEFPYKKVKLATLRQHCDELLDYTEYSKLKEAANFYSTLRMLRETIIREQHTVTGRQTKIDSFFAPRPPHPQVEPQPDSPEPQPDSPEPQPDSPEPLEVSDSE